jgi:general secretion pathway protein G
MKRRTTGFTLIEMMVVLALVGILAAGARPLLELSVRRSQEFALRQGLRTLRNAIDAYKQAADEGRIARAPDTSGYPPSLDVLVQGVPLQAAGGAAPPADSAAEPAQRLYLLRRLPRDPFAAPGVNAVQSWGLRSYQSAPDSPAPGRDVFDVYSPSERTALDGTAYRDW